MQKDDIPSLNLVRGGDKESRAKAQNNVPIAPKK